MRISLKGLIYILAAVLLLVMGIVRKELIAEICGAVLSLYIVFACIASGITALLWCKTVPEVTMKKNVFFISPQSEKQQFPFCIVGVSAYFVVELSSEYPAKRKELLPVFIPLQKYKTRFTVSLPQRRRYFYVCRYISISDFAGFFSCKIAQPDFDFSIRRTPFFMRAPVIPFSALTIPTSIAAVSSFEPSIHRTAELYESRSYFPGDDPRKIHWKLYAHTRSLAIRLGEYEPPPVKTVSIYIENPKVINQKEGELLTPFFDAFIGRISFFVMQLLANGFSCRVLLHDMLYPSTDSDSAAALLEKKAAEKNTDCTEIYPYIISGDEGRRNVRELFTVPQISRTKKNSNRNFDVVYNAVPHGGVLFYFYIPLLKSRNTMERKDAEQNALKNTNVRTFFYAASAGEGIADKKNPVQSDFPLLKKIPALESFLYSTRNDRMSARYANSISKAAERDVKILTEGHGNVQIL